MCSLLHRAGHEPHDLEALVTRHGRVLHDLDAIAGLVFVLLVVRLVALTNADVLLVDAVQLEANDFDHHRLVHLVAHHAADELARAGRAGIVSGGAGCSGVFGHDALPPEEAAAVVARSLRIPSMRASSRRAL